MRRNSGVRVCCVCALTEGTPAVDDDIDTESNSTISQADSETAVVPTMTDLQLTMRLYRRLTRERPVSVNGKLPTLDDVRALITAGFSACNDLWKVTAPKKVVSRSVTRRCQLLHIYDRPATGTSVVVGTDKVCYSYALAQGPVVTHEVSSVLLTISKTDAHGISGIRH